MDLAFGPSETLAAIAAGLVGTVIGIQSVVKGWKESKTESNIITLMHSELERMSSQNILLSSELNKLQVEIIHLNKEIRDLSSENQKLYHEVASITSEVSLLRDVIINNSLENRVGRRVTDNKALYARTSELLKSSPLPIIPIDEFGPVQDSESSKND
jgi:peptidoglycan hydrolase CwlO-like protein